MNAVVEEARENVAEFRAPGPGERLRAARMSAGLTLSSVANRLHLDVDMIDLLERDQYDLLPERVFVQGYVRNYARLVGLPLESVLKQLDEHCPGCEVRKFENVGKSVDAEVRSSSLLVRLITLGIVLGMAALFFVWWKGYLTWLQNEEPQSIVVTESTNAPVAEADGSLRLPRLSLSANATRASQPSGGALEAVPVKTPGVSSTSITDPLVQQSNEVALPATQVSAVTEASGLASPTPARVVGLDDAAVIPQATTPPVSIGEQQVVLEFFEPCWVDVRDSTRDFKLIGEMAKGAQKILGGEPPYNVVIGKSSAVRVTVDGAFFDIRRYARGNVARFTLDPSSMN